ncbi:MAG: Gfo/Idh/MocA family oxidoreductase [Anaerolineae bacterium]|jgi:predicted dehydrogenase|nr:Gfo/Idh/MocA family oxidoreductase [Anaerolineae bacterium]
MAEDSTTPAPRRLRMGMVGGGRGSFIGATHYRAATLDGGIALVAGALSSTPERARLSAADFGIARERAYGSWQEMLERERALPAGERLDLVSVVTPNHLHFPVALAFVTAGFNVLIDKPMVHTTEEARRLAAAVEAAGTVLAVSLNYTGYPMVKQARHMVREGLLGEIRKVVVEYNQGWLATRLEDTGHKQAAWRTDPAISGPGGAMADIGSHAENLVSTITGLELAEVCADLSHLVPGRRLDDDANVLLRFGNGARGVLVASQVATGSENDLSIKVWGTRAGLAWRQQQPNDLAYTPAGGPVQLMTRGTDDLCPAARRASRLPAGHPEGFLEAFANIYRNVADTIRARQEGREPTALESDFPTVYDGARGVFFIEKVVESNQSTQKWLPARWVP